MAHQRSAKLKHPMRHRRVLNCKLACSSCMAPASPLLICGCVHWATSRLRADDDAMIALSRLPFLRYQMQRLCRQGRMADEVSTALHWVSRLSFRSQNTRRTAENCQCTSKSAKHFKSTTIEDVVGFKPPCSRPAFGQHDAPRVIYEQLSRTFGCRLQAMQHV